MDNDVLDPLPIDMPEEDIEQEKEKRKEEEVAEKKLSKSLDKYIIFSFSCIILYTIVNILLALRTGMEMSVLTSCIFAFFGGEILSCAMIKKFKLKENNGGNHQ